MGPNGEANILRGGKRGQIGLTLNVDILVGTTPG